MTIRTITLAIGIALPMAIAVSHQSVAASVPAGSIAGEPAVPVTQAKYRSPQYRARGVRRYYNYAPGGYQNQPHDPYYGTPFENVAPYSARNPYNPYRGTRWYGVAPY
jgi:hypothetical protein